MADFANYTPGEYAKEHIRITPATLADGRDFFYLDDDPEFVSGAKTRELKDPRPLDYRFAPHLDADGNEVPYAAPQMRRDPLTGDWIPMATARMNRPITAGPGATAKGNPLAARKPGDPVPGRRSAGHRLQRRGVREPLPLDGARARCLRGRDLR